MMETYKILKMEKVVLSSVLFSSRPIHCCHTATDFPFVCDCDHLLSGLHSDIPAYEAHPAPKHSR